MFIIDSPEEVQIHRVRLFPFQESFSSFSVLYQPIFPERMNSSGSQNSKVSVPCKRIHLRKKRLGSVKNMY